MFKRMAIPAAAAVLLLVGFNLFDSTSLNEVLSNESTLDELVMNGEWTWTEDLSSITE